MLRIMHGRKFRNCEHFADTRIAGLIAIEGLRRALRQAALIVAPGVEIDGVEFGMSRDGGRAKLAYDWYGSWTTLYSLYADAILCFHPDANSTDLDFASDGLQFPIVEHARGESNL